MEKKKQTEGTVFISEADQYLFAQGTHYDIYKKLGAHPSVENGRKGTFFGVWAPNAASVHVIGTFNGWNEEAAPMTKLGAGGIWTVFLPGVGTGELYKFLITAPSGEKLYKADPFANSAEMRPGTASKTVDISGYKWTDDLWLREREERDYYKEPLAIYECHIGSWMRHPRPEEQGFYNYREFADRIVEYLKEMKYTHVELMGIAEYPFDGSWGYQVTGYYAPTARYGDPQDFMYLVNKLHRNKIGVILDWVPAHFATDAHGLGRFDGQCIFEDPDPRKGEHPDWGTKIFNYGKNEVKNFLIANALFWIKEFHIDGIRVDAVASMLYLDYGKKEGEWIPNIYGGNENLDAVEFLKHLNSIMKKKNPDVYLIAEESTAWPKVTGEVEEDGLGFSMKWNMGFMNDYLSYISYDPYFRAHHHNELTFSMVYQYSENFMSVFSHDEVVHGKSTMIGKMPGNKEDKFANLRLTYAYMMTHPGKKLLFMGQDIAEYKEFDETRQTEWGLLQYPEHKGISKLVKDLNFLYKNKPALYKKDTDPDGFEWINCISSDKCMLSFVRKADKLQDMILVVANFAGIEQEFTVGVPAAGKYKELFTTDDKIYGGNSSRVTRAQATTEEEADGRENSIHVVVPSLSLVMYSYAPYTQKELAEIERKKEAAMARRKAKEAMKEAEEARKEADLAREEAGLAQKKAEAAEERAKAAMERAKAADREAQEKEKA